VTIVAQAGKLCESTVTLDLVGVIQVGGNRRRSSPPAWRGAWVLSAAFSADGRTVVIASDDITALIWLASIEDLLAEAARRIQRDPPIFTEEERRRFLLEG